MNIGALVFTNHQAYVARKISTEFAETDHVARAMSLIVSFDETAIASSHMQSGFNLFPGNTGRTPEQRQPASDILCTIWFCFHRGHVTPPMHFFAQGVVE